ncbi:DUF1963 domain-containing protein, partial [Rossellomorea marisflavi]
ETLFPYTTLFRSANFFIKKEDLKKKQFGNVVYNWDCS